MKNIKRIFKLLFLTKKNTFILLSLIFIASILGLIVPWIYKNIIDLLTNTIKGDTDYQLAIHTLFRSTIILTIIFISEGGVNIITNYWWAKWYLELAHLLRMKVFNHIQNLSLEYFEEESVGKIKERADRGIWDLQEVLDGIFMIILPQILIMVIVVIILIKINFYLTVLSFIGLPLHIILTYTMTKKLIKKYDQARNAFEKLSGRIVQAITNIKLVKSFVKESYEIKRVNDLSLLAVKRDKESIFLRQKYNFPRFLAVIVSRIAIFGYGGYLAIQGDITIGTIVLFFSYAERIYQPLWWMTWVFDNIQKSMRSVKRVFDLLEQKPKIIDKPGAKTLTKVKGRVDFENITFAYKKRKPVLKNINFEIKPGEMIALVGPSGAGKSTVVKLLLRFYDPQKGQILIDGYDIKNVTQDSLRQNISIVLQETILFNDTVKANIIYGKPNASEKEIIAAAKMAYAHNFIQKLPKKYNTLVGERGVKLSAGEAQRIALARAIIKNPSILILDEATSQLDSESERLIQKALRKITKKRTTLIIAHRLSTVMKADKILVIKNGRIIESGKHKDLIKRKNSFYKYLFELQTGKL